MTRQSKRQQPAGSSRKRPARAAGRRGAGGHAADRHDRGETDSRQGHGKFRAFANRLARRPRPSRLRRYWFSRRGFKMFLKLGAAGLAALFLAGLFMLQGIGKDMAAVQNLSGSNLGGSVRFYDSTGKVLLWNDYHAADHTPIAASQIPAMVRDATVAVEDKDFYHEGPINVSSMLRAAIHDVLHRGSGLQGGSTITEQLVKMDEGWTGGTTLSRKVKEMALAYDIGHEHSKDDILTAYLNRVPYGGQDYGIEAAAQDYFHLRPDQLSLAQAAMLAAIPNAPSYYSPRGPYFDAAALKNRQDHILSLMRQQGYISAAQAASAARTDVLAQVQSPQGLYAGMTAPYFDLVAQQQLRQQFGSLITSGKSLKVTTTLNLGQQRQAEKLVAGNLANVRDGGGDDEALVVENVPTGQVTALVGGTDFSNPDYGKINYATAPINPGSSYKLYDYTALLNSKNNVGAGSVLYDSKQPLPGYPCTDQAVPGGNCLYDYDYQYPGPLTLRYALAGSRNVPAVKAMLLAGEQNTINLSKSMGLTSGYNCYSDAAKTKPTACYDSAAIGYGYLSLDQSVNGYATDARLGNYLPQSFILTIAGSAGRTLYQWQPARPQRVVKPDAAYIVDNMLSDPAASYLPGSCGATDCTPISDFGWKFQRTNGWDVAVKTGTTEADNSGLMMAMTSQYSVGSWVGYHTAVQPLTPHYGGLEGLTEPLTRGMIGYLTQGQKPVNWTRPSDIKVLPSYVVNHPATGAQGLYYGWKYPGPSTDLYPSWYNVPAVSAAETCDASAFSVDSYAPPASAGRPACGAAPSTPPSAASLAAITINSVACDSPDKCDVTVTVTQDTGASSGGTFSSTPSGVITILENGQAVTSVGVPPDAGQVYTTTIGVDYLPATTVIGAEVAYGGSQTVSASPITLSPG